MPGWCPAVGETRFPSIGFRSESNADTMLSLMLTRLVKISCPPLNLDLAIHNLCNFLAGLSGSWILRATINDQGYTGVATESSLQVFTIHIPDGAFLFGRTYIRRVGAVGADEWKKQEVRSIAQNQLLDGLTHTLLSSPYLV